MGDNIANKEGFELIQFFKAYGQILFTLIGFIYFVANFQFRMDNMGKEMVVHAEEIDKMEGVLINIDKNLTELNTSIKEGVKPSIVEIQLDIKEIQNELRRNQ